MKEQAAIMTRQLSIEGMTCGHCVKHVKKALTGVAGVKAVEVDLAAKRAVVEGDAIDDGALTDAVTDAGYVVVGIR